MSDLYTPKQIAAETGCSERTVRRYLLERFPSHTLDSWWRLEEEEHQTAVKELLDALLDLPSQPLRILHQRARNRSQVCLFFG